MGKGYRNYNAKSNDIASCRGFSCIVATCDSSREREASKELVNLINQSIELLYQNDNTNNNSDNGNTSSICDLLAQEIALVNNQTIKTSQNVISIMTNMKGIVLAKIILKEASPNDIIVNIFDRILSEKKPISKYIVRLIPLTKVFYPNEDDLFVNAYELIQIEFPFMQVKDAKILYNDIKNKRSNKKPINDITDGIESDEDPAQKKQKYHDDSNEIIDSNESIQNDEITEVIDSANADIVNNNSPIISSKPLKYDIIYKARNHNQLLKNQVQKNINTCVPLNSEHTYKNPEIIFMVESIKNICGLSIIRNYNDLMEYNIRKYQNEFTIAADGFLNTSLIKVDKIDSVEENSAK